MQPEAKSSVGRLILAGQRHPGDTVSAPCLQSPVQAAATATGVRPHRRPDLVANRVQALASEVDGLGAQVRRATARLDGTRGALTAAEADLAGRTAHVAHVIAQDAGRALDRPD